MSKAALKRRDQKLLRLYEQGASETRVEAYLSRWERWAEEGLQDRLTAPPKPVIKRLATLSAGIAAFAGSSAYAGVVEQTEVILNLTLPPGFSTDHNLNGDAFLDIGVFNGLVSTHLPRSNVELVLLRIRFI